MRTGKHTQRPKAYSVRFNTELFMSDVNAKRLQLGWDWRDVAEVTGIPSSTLSHIHVNKIKTPGGNIMVSLLHWMGRTDVQRYMLRGDLNKGDTP